MKHYPGISKAMVEEFWKSATPELLVQLTSNIRFRLQADSDNRLKALNGPEQLERLTSFLMSSAPSIQKRACLSKFFHLTESIAKSDLVRTLENISKTEGVDFWTKRDISLLIEIFEGRIDTSQAVTKEFFESRAMIPSEIDVVVDKMRKSQDTLAALRESSPDYYYLTIAKWELERGNIIESRNAFESWLAIVIESHYP
jgi:hypothetical protein